VKISAPTVAPPSIYGAPFWLAYASNATLVAAVALLFRYADFITLLGGTEFHLGWIVGVGMIGSLFMRLALGTWIDRHGARMSWLCSALLLAATCFAHLAVASHTGVAIYALRIAYCCALAGVNAASMTFVSSRGPGSRMAELVGMLGTAGFLGTVLGTLLGDVLIGSVQVERGQVVLMFVAAGLLSLCACPLAWLATRSETRPTHAPEASPWNVLRRHCSIPVMVLGVAMGFGLGLPGVFLRTYAAELGIPRIGLFFLIYAAAAIVTRVLTRRWSERFGPRPIILLGTSGMAVSVALFLVVRAEWHLIVPAVCFGFSHAILFPAVVAAGSLAFPVRHRGLATIMVLAAWDIGQVVGSPMAGAILHFSAPAGLPPYPTMFLAVSSLLGLVGLWYAVQSAKTPVGQAVPEARP